jgi:hypothetical protein
MPTPNPILRPRSPRRRGSALIIVIGTLALVAVFAAFYVTLGQADTRVSATVERTSELDAVEGQIADYIASVVAADRLAVYPDTITNDEDLVGGRVLQDGDPPQSATEADRQRFVREATDYPYTDYLYKSMIVAGNAAIGEGGLSFDPSRYASIPGVFNTTNLDDAVERFRFRPAGDHPVMLDKVGDSITLRREDDALRDFRVASDPWLASAEPEFTGRTGSGLPIDRRLFSENALQLAGLGFQEEYHYLDNRDWRQISNLAPDGLSVNLFNLRGNFDAEPGLGVGLDGRSRMAENRTLLTLRNPGGANPESDFLLRATDRLPIDPDGSGGLPSFLNQGDAVAFAIRNTPAWWTMNQRFLYFPAEPGFQILGRGVDSNGVPVDSSFVTPQTWATPDYPDYQYADADGDGFYDSRWFELTDSTFGFIGAENLLKNESDMRFFFAARVIDLSGRVNVNSATDGLTPPTSEVTAGATPAEIDLRRLLTMQDVSERYRPVFEHAGLPSSPPSGSQRLSYAHIERLSEGARQLNPLNSGRLVAEDYEGYLTISSSNPGIGALFPFVLDGPGINAGRYAYDALRREIQGDQFRLSPASTNLRWQASTFAQPLQNTSPFEYFDFTPGNEGMLSYSVADAPRNTWTVTPTLAELASMARWRRDYWFDIGGVNIADPNDAPITALGLGGRLFDLDDLTELLTFNGANDDSRLSRLERTLQGRFEDPDAGGFDESTRRLGPLRANRPTDLERRGHDNWLNAQNQPVTNLRDYLIDFESMALAALNPRTRLTTLSGAAPLRSRIVEDADADGVLSAGERRLTDADARLDLVNDAADPAALFSLYADALAPYARVDATWNIDPEAESISQFGFAQMRTLAYGHRGSELALRLSAHLAVNMADLYDEDDTPSAYTVVASPRNDIRRNLEQNWPNTFRDETFFPWWTEGKRLDLGDENLAPDETDVNGDYSRIAYNVYGLEPQPFITEVAVLTLFSDVPQGRISNPDADGFRGVTLSEDESTGPTPGNNERLVVGNPNPLDPDPPADDWTDDDVTIRTDISPENPDLIAHVLAIQLTNPFDVPIVLSGEDQDANGGTDGGALNSNPTSRIEDAKYYLEFNGHFFPLAAYFERDPDLNPADGTFFPPGDTNRAANRLYPVTLRPGESRVFYVSAHPNIADMNRRWTAIDSVYGPGPIVPGVSTSGIFQQPPTDLANRNPFEEFLATQFTVTDENGLPLHGGTTPGNANDPRWPVRLLPFNPVTGDLGVAGVAQSDGGTFVDFLRTSLAFRNPGTDEAYDRMRQEVRLWRRMAIDNNENTITDNEAEDYTDTSNENWLHNDLLVDRLRDPLVPRMTTVTPETRAALDYAAYDADDITSRAPANFYQNWNEVLTGSGVVATQWQSADVLTVPLTTVTDDSGPWSNTNQGITFVRFAGYRRPDHLRDNNGSLEAVLNDDDLAPRGLLPAWCVEGTDTNFNLLTPIEDDLDIDQNNDGAADEPSPFVQTLEGIRAVPITGRHFGYNGNAGGAGGTATGQPTPGGDYPAYFTKNLRKLLLQVLPTNELNPANLGYTVPDTALIPTLRRHPALKSERGVEDPLDLAGAMSGIGAAGNLRPTDAKTPSVMGTAEAGQTTPRYLDDRTDLLLNNSDGFGFDTTTRDPRTAGVRLGDLLMPLGVGTTFAPRLGLSAPWAWTNPANFRPGDWTTVAEALSAALGLEPPAFNNKDPDSPGYSLLCELVSSQGVATRQAGFPTPNDSLAVTTQNRFMEYVLDRGRLDLEAYTPFVNTIQTDPATVDATVRFNPPVQLTEVNGDYRVALSVPPAQRLLSMAQALTRGGDPLTTPVIGTININTAPDAVLRTIPGFATSLQFSPTAVQYDLYNPNSSPLISEPGIGVDNPLVSQNLTEWAPGRVAGKVFGAYFDFADFTGSTPVRPLPFGIGDPFAFVEPWKNRAEIAPALAAFRDRAAASFRVSSINPNLLGDFAVGVAAKPGVVFDFTPSPNLIVQAFGTATGGQGAFLRALSEQNFARDFARSAVNGSLATSDRPGMSGVGALLGLSVASNDPLGLAPNDVLNTRIRSAAPRANVEGWRSAVRDQASQGGLLRLGFDQLAMRAKDQDLNGEDDPNGDGTDIANFRTLGDLRQDDDFSYTLGRGLFRNENPDLNDEARLIEDELADDIAEKLAVLNGAANTVDVRSDFFAAWFIVRGYRESDVTNLEPEEPMSPTYQKRFLMILDRSNVTEAGQAPRVLLLREVPL